MTGIDKQALAEFCERGYVVVPGVLDERQVALGRRVIAAMLTAEPPPVGHRGPYFLWPRFAPTGECGHDHGLLRFYRTSGIADLAAALLSPEMPPDDPAFAQLAATVPPWPHHPGGPHVDGISPPEADGRPGTFSLLAGALLTDQSERDQGNLWVWPGTHVRFGAYLAAHGADALGRLHPDPYPPISLGSPVQVMGPAGSVLFAHYLLAHNIGGHCGGLGEPMRQVVYYRLQAHGHRDRWRSALTDPLSEFRSP